MAVYTSSLDKSGRIVSKIEHSGMRAISLRIDGSKPIDVSIAEIEARLLIVATAEDLQQLPEIVRAAHSVDRRVIAIIDRGSDCALAADAGVDDFIVEPFSAAELEVRIRRLLGERHDAEVIRVEGLEIVPDSYEVSVDGRPLKLTFKEYELLKHFATNPGRVLTRQALLNQIWEYDYYGGTRTVDVHVRRLRAKLGSRYSEFIKTVRQVGYKFER